MRTAIALLILLLATSLSAQILDTEVWVGKLDVKEGKLAVSGLKNVSGQHPGYDNQPSFFPDGASLVYSSETGGLSDTGHGIQPVRVSLKDGKRVPMKDARGFSPTPATDGTQLMVLRDGGVWLHDLDGKLVRQVVKTKDAGYFSRFDDRLYVLFLNNEQRPIVIYDAEQNSTETMIAGAITAPVRIPGKRAVTFVVADAENVRTLHELDVETKKVTTVAEIPFPTSGNHVWTSRGTLLMASGNSIYEWKDEWKVAYRAEHPELQGITRIALSPAGDRIALVSTTGDETTIRNTRAASNAALAVQDAAGAASVLAQDAKVLTSRGVRLEGREAREKALAAQFAEQKDLVYVRTPSAIEVKGDAATERGKWRGTWTGKKGPEERRGTYTATWRRTVSSNGTPSWVIAAEEFVPEAEKPATPKEH
ncbi:MAG TPA: DUF4440 domain-containing protein [Thermoanaerobaculia bacterium]|nr:DUF4440 domain-containing protein [Thermoanaerobaculia bacterium]